MFNILPLYCLTEAFPRCLQPLVARHLNAAQRLWVGIGDWTKHEGAIFGYFRGGNEERLSAEHLDRVFDTISSLFLRPGINMPPGHDKFNYESFLGMVKINHSFDAEGCNTKGVNNVTRLNKSFMYQLIESLAICLAGCSTKVPQKPKKKDVPWEFFNSDFEAAVNHNKILIFYHSIHGCLRNVFYPPDPVPMHNPLHESPPTKVLPAPVMFGPSVDNFKIDKMTTAFGRMGKDWNNMCHHGVCWSFEHYERGFNDVGCDNTNLPKVGSDLFDSTLARTGRKVMVNHFAVLCHFRFTDFNKVIFVDGSNNMMDESFVFKLYPEKYDKYWRRVYN